MKRDFRILTEIGNLLKEKNITSKNIENEFKNKLFPLSLFAKKGNFLNQKTYDYINSNNLSITPSSSKESTVTSTSTNLMTVAKVKTRNDIMLKYLKTFSIFNKKKKWYFNKI